MDLKGAKDILEFGLNQRIGGLDGELVEALCAEIAELRDRDTCARQCEGTAYRIEARRQRHRAEALVDEIALLRGELAVEKQWIKSYSAQLAQSTEGLLRLDPNGKAGYLARHPNGVTLGEISQSEDGYYVFWPELRGGYWDDFVLRALAERLVSLNAEWNAVVMANCGPEASE